MSAQVAQMVNHESCLFDAIDQWFDPAFGQLAELFFFSPFSKIVKAFIFNKNEGNNQKVENKVSGGVRVGAERALYCTNKAASI